MSFNPEQVNKDKDINYQEVLQQIKPDEGDFESVELTEDEDEELLSILKKARKAEKKGNINRAINLYKKYKEKFQNIKDIDKGLKATERDKKIWNEIKNSNFDNINELGVLNNEVAKHLASFNGDSLNLNNLQKINSVQAEFLSKFKGAILSLNGLKKITNQQAKYLSSFRGEAPLVRLNLGGLEEISEKQAKYLSNFRGDYLDLKNLQKLSEEKAKELSKLCNRAQININNETLKEKINKYRK